MWQEFSELLFPRRCLACNAFGLSMCEMCKKDLQFSLRIRHVGNLPVYSCASFTPVARKVLLSAKEDGIKAADRLIIDALKFAVSQGLPRHSIALQPIPSQKNRIRQRGRSFVSELTKDLCNQKVTQVDLLGYCRKVRDQSTLSAQERTTNLSHAFSVSAKKFPNSEEIFLVDDLVTTGATLSEANRALTLAGFVVAGAITAFSA